MLSLRRIKRGLRSPRLVAQHVNKIYYRARYGSEYPAGEDLVAQDWDNLLILDACRYDAFEQLNTIDGDVTKKTSKASSTVGFLRTNVDGKDLNDTVYVTGNPQLVWMADRIDHDFHDVVNVWSEDGWDDAHQTVLPETMVEYAGEAHREFPDKRLIVHFVQPHCPFIGEFGREAIADSNIDFWPKLREGQLDVATETLRRAYRENIECVLPAAERLVGMLGGKSVITSDHGQVISKRSFPIPVREYGHPEYTYLPELLEVPWLVCDGDERRRVRREASREETDSENVEARLRQLGYTT